MFLSLLNLMFPSWSTVETTFIMPRERRGEERRRGERRVGGERETDITERDNRKRDSPTHPLVLKRDREIE